MGTLVSQGPGRDIIRWKDDGDLYGRLVKRWESLVDNADVWARKASAEDGSSDEE